MFANVGWGEMLLLVIVGPVVLVAERLPGAIQRTAAFVRRARGYLTGATPSFDRGRPNHQPYRHIVRCRICPHSGKVVLIPGNAR
jgi:Sec-independent protein translocase protein TatA